MAMIIDGKAVSKKYREELSVRVAQFIERTGVQPGIAVIIVGDDPASKIYVRNKKRACGECGMYSREFALPAETTQSELLSLIDELNRDKSIHGILVQSPTPAHIDESVIYSSIDPRKDVDAWHPSNVGRIMLGDFDFLPCTPAGVMVLLEEYGVDVKGKECVVVGRSNTVGKPQAMLLLHKHATVTICHSRTVNLGEVTRRADVLIVAVGKPELIRGNMIKKGAVVIDVGMNRTEDGRLLGDVAFDEANEVASLITPVPGGVGPMTITMLMENTLTAAKRLYDGR